MRTPQLNSTQTKSISSGIIQKSFEMNWRDVELPSTLPNLSKQEEKVSIYLHLFLSWLGLKVFPFKIGVSDTMIGIESIFQRQKGNGQEGALLKFQFQNPN